MRRYRFSIAVLGLTILFAGLSFGQGPLTNALNLMVRTDSNGSLYVYGVAAGAQGPLTNLGNVRLRTYSPGSLAVTVAGGTITPDVVTLANGTAGAPSLRFSDADTGLFSNAGSTIQFSFDSVNLYSVQSNGLFLFSDTAQIVMGSAFDTVLTRDAANVFAMKNSTNLQSFRVYDASGTGFSALSGTGITTYKNVTTVGQGVSSIYGYGNTVAATNVGTASIATFTPAADGTFEVGCNVLITTSTTHSFSCDVTYTDEGNSARTMVLPMASLAGAFITNGLITNVTGAGPYESPVMTIRVKASTAITVRTSAGGTFTTVVYNARGVIKQVG